MSLVTRQLREAFWYVVDRPDGFIPRKLYTMGWTVAFTEHHVNQLYLNSFDLYKSMIFSTKGSNALTL
jgi:hypothetical protein